ncbi:MAG: hypothetical protein ACTSXU_01965, partial [Promethearchaeota archaeon]
MILNNSMFNFNKNIFLFLTLILLAAIPMSLRDQALFSKDDEEDSMILSTDSRPEVSASTITMKNHETLFWQSLGEATGAFIAGVNSQEGNVNETDIIVAGGTGSGSLRSLQGYNTSVYPGGYYFMSDNDDKTTDMLRFPSRSGNQDIIAAFEETMGDGGRIQRYKLAGSSQVYSDPIVQWDFTGAPNIMTPESMCIGEFDGDSDPEIIVKFREGDVVLISNPDTASWGRIYDFMAIDGSPTISKNNLAIMIDDIDGADPGRDDLIVANLNNVTAINMNSSHAELWSILLPYDVSTLTLYPDINSDGTDEILAGTYHGIYLINGNNGSIIAGITGIGSMFRAVEPFNDYNGDGTPEVIAGNSEGVVLLIDVNASSPTFGKVLKDETFRSHDPIWSILNIGDTNSDSHDDFAVGGNIVGVLEGNNMSWRWLAGNIGAEWNSGYDFEVRDICLLNDMNSDGINDI